MTQSRWLKRHAVPLQMRLDAPGSAKRSLPACANMERASLMFSGRLYAAVPAHHADLLFSGIFDNLLTDILVQQFHKSFSL